jgi:hypothetical protein
VTFAAAATVPASSPRFFGAEDGGEAVIIMADSLFSDGATRQPLPDPRYKVVHMVYTAAAVYAGHVDVARCALGRAKRVIHRTPRVGSKFIVEETARHLRECYREKGMRHDVTVLLGNVGRSGSSFVARFDSPRFEPKRMHAVSTIGDPDTDTEFRRKLGAWPRPFGPPQDGSFAAAFTGAVNTRHAAVAPPVQGYVITRRNVVPIGVARYESADDVWTKESEPPQDLR